jgi:16S rRNA (guanine527-N7)-methyltransferase
MTDVSDAPVPSESLPPVPPAAVKMFSPDVVARLEDYGQQLATEGVIRGLIGPREVPRLWDRHLLNCAALAELIQPGECVADIGTGAGLPGLVLALVRTDIQVILVEPLQRRCDFLFEMIVRFKLGSRVSVRRGKAHRVQPCQADVVTSRAVAALDKLATWSLPHAKIGGRLLAMKGDRAVEELAGAGDVLKTFGAEEGAQVLSCGDAWLETPVQVVCAVRTR